MTAADIHLHKWAAFARANTHLQQFGQRDDESTFGGKTGCTHAILQRLIKGKTGDTYSQDEISKIAGYPWPADNEGMRGMYSGGGDDEVGRVMHHFGLPYAMNNRLKFGDILYLTKTRGPVLIGIRYGWWPEWPGYKYNGRRSDGIPGGIADIHGKSQLTGAETIYHAILIIGHRNVRSVDRTYANEPNHGSPARPERPDYDRVRSSYAKRAYEHYTSTGRKPLAWMPTREFLPKGY